VQGLHSDDLHWRLPVLAGRFTGEKIWVPVMQIAFEDAQFWSYAEDHHLDTPIF
jgi:hypothetical protein